MIIVVKPDLQTPFIVRVFGDKVKEWKKVGGATQLIFHNSKFSEMYVLRVPIPLSFDVKHVFIAITPVVSREKMNQEMKEAYKLLKGTEATLKYRGLFSRTPFFDHLPKLSQLKAYIPELEISNLVTARLNSDTELLKLIKDVKPGKINIELKSIPEYMVFGGQAGDARMQAEVYYYSDPTEITWITTLETMIIRGPKVRKSSGKILEILNRISQHLIDASSSIISKAK